MHGLVLSQLDYCNSLYYGLPNCDIHSLQMILNSAARIIVGMPRFSRARITPVCIELHFLPIRARVEYKICLLVYKAINFNEPRYISDLLKPFTTSSGLELRSAGRLSEPFLSRSAGVNRCFEYCAPRLFNQLPQELQSESSILSFKRKLKTYFFTRAYDMSSRSINSHYSV